LDEEVGKTLLFRSLPAQQAAAAATEQCERNAQRAALLAREVLRPDAGNDAGGSLGSAIAAQVFARRIARAACAVAAVRLRGQSPSDARSALSKRLDGANASWQELP
jgi:hypothetical protein